jgi:hypothetical protein
MTTWYVQRDYDTLISENLLNDQPDGSGSYGYPAAGDTVNGNGKSEVYINASCPLYDGVILQGCNYILTSAYSFGDGSSPLSVDFTGAVYGRLQTGAYLLEITKGFTFNGNVTINASGELRLRGLVAGDIIVEAGGSLYYVPSGSYTGNVSGGGKINLAEMPTFLLGGPYQINGNDYIPSTEEATRNTDPGVDNVADGVTYKIQGVDKEGTLVGGGGTAPTVDEIAARLLTNPDNKITSDASGNVRAVDGSGNAIAPASTALSSTVYTNSRAGYLDYLNVGGNVASSAEVVVIQNNTRCVRVVPQQMPRPADGSATYRIELFLYDAAGAMEAPDSAPTLSVVNAIGTDRSANLDSGTMTLVSTGRYRSTYTVASTHAAEELIITFSVTEGGATRVYANAAIVCDTVAVDFTAADRAKLGALADDRLTAARAAKLDAVAQVGSAMGLADGAIKAATITDGAITSAKFTIGTIAGPATGILEQLRQLWRRFFAKATATSSAMTTYADDGTTAITTQGVSDDGTTQTVGAAQ